MTTEKRFNLHLPGLLQVLAGSLYSSPRVGVRELIQNAHDSCTRRRVNLGESDFRPKIHIQTDKANRTLTIIDNGEGLTEHEIETYLTTIGRSYTGEYKNELSFFEPKQARELIGQFGFGFLSAFLLADEILLTTRSVKAGHDALHWRSAGGEAYTVESAVRPFPGTTIKLKVKPEASFVFNERLLQETIRQFADLLPIPIFLNHNRTPVNLGTVPWATGDEPTLQRYIERTFDEQQPPLAIIQLHKQTIELGRESIEVPLSGFLFVPSGSTHGVQEHGDLTVFIRKMFILDKEQSLLPRWARFVRGVIDCPQLQPTASRENIHQDAAYQAVRRALAAQLSAGLRHIAQAEPSKWRDIVLSHSSVMKGWAVRDDAFFKQVADLLPFHTSRGQLTLPDYLKLTGQTFYYVSKRMSSLQQEMLAEGSGVPMIDAHWYAVRPFLKKYAEWQGDIQLVPMDGEVSHLIREVATDQFASLLSFYRKLGIDARIGSFEPAATPALVVYSADAEFLIEANQAIEEDELPSPFAALVSDYIGRKSPTANTAGILYLNAACPLIAQLRDTPKTNPARNAMLTLLYQQARLFSGRTLNADSATAAFEASTQALQTMLEAARE